MLSRLSAHAIPPNPQEPGTTNSRTIAFYWEPMTHRQNARGVYLQLWQFAYLPCGVKSY